MDSKAIGLMLTIVLLTQSMDVYLILIVLLLASVLMVQFFKGRKVRIVLNQ